MSKKKEKEKLFKIMPDPSERGQYWVVARDGRPICQAFPRRGRPVFEMRAGGLRLLHMSYVDDESEDEAANGEFWVKEEYAHRVPVW